MTTVESQRVLAVLDESIKKTEIVSLLPYAIQNVNKYSSMLSDDLQTALHEHGNLQNNLQDTFMKLKEHREAKAIAEEELARQAEDEDSQMGSEEGSPRESIKSKEEQTQSELDEIDEIENNLVKMITAQEYQVTFSCKNLLRMFGPSPALVNSLRSEVKERDERASQMILYLKDLKGFILERLLTTPLEEKEKMEYLQEISVREKKNREVMEKLSTELEGELAEKDTEVSIQSTCWYCFTQMLKGNKVTTNLVSLFNHTLTLAPGMMEFVVNVKGLQLCLHWTRHSLHPWKQTVVAD